MAGNGIDDVAAAAKKVADEDIKVPRMPSAVQKAWSEVEASKKKFDKMRDEMKGQIQDLHKSVFELAQEYDQWGKLVEKSDLGMDAKGKDYKKKRADVQKLFDKWFDEQEKTCVSNASKVNEVAKHLTDMVEYKSPPSP